MSSTLSLVLLVLLPLSSYAQNACSSYSFSSCASPSVTQCSWFGTASSGSCNCTSDKKLDILFGIDASGSIGFDNFQIEKHFVELLVLEEINNDISRIGFFMFSTFVNQTRNISFYTDNELITFIRGMYWSRGYTNTQQLINDAIDEFESQFESDRDEIFVIVTDGNPCSPSASGGCPQSVCEFQSELSDAGITTVVIGVGDVINRENIECLTTDNGGAFVEVANFTEAAFDSVLGTLSDILCPITTQNPSTDPSTYPTPQPTRDPTFEPCNVVIPDSDECVTGDDCIAGEICYDRSLPNGEFHQVVEGDICDPNCTCYCLGSSL